MESLVMIVIGLSIMSLPNNLINPARRNKVCQCHCLALDENGIPRWKSFAMNL